MNAPVIVEHRCLAPADPSPIERIAELCVQMALMTAEKKSVVLEAVMRISGDELAKLEGHEQAAQRHARRARIHHERGLNLVRGRGR